MTLDDKMKEIVALLRQLTEDSRIAWEQTTHDGPAAVAHLWWGGVQLHPHSLDLLDDAGKVESTYTPTGADAEALAALYGLAVAREYSGMVDSVLQELKVRSFKS
jgi:hypothetical protein